MASAAKKRRRDTQYTLDTSVVRLTHEVKDHIKGKSRWGESIDHTLRRLLKLKPWTGTDQEKRKHA